MKRSKTQITALAGLLASGLALAGNEMASPSPQGAELYFIMPQDDAVVSSPVTVKFGLRGMGVAPAGIDKPNTGHHHLHLLWRRLPVRSEHQRQ